MLHLCLAFSLLLFLFECCCVLLMITQNMYIFIVVYNSVDQTSTTDERVKTEDLLIAASLPKKANFFFIFSFYIYISTNRYSLRIQLSQQTNMLAAIKMFSSSFFYYFDCLVFRRPFSLLFYWFLPLLNTKNTHTHSKSIWWKLYASEVEKNSNSDRYMQKKRGEKICIKFEKKV